MPARGHTYISRLPQLIGLMLCMSPCLGQVLLQLPAVGSMLPYGLERLQVATRMSACRNS